MSTTTDPDSEPLGQPAERDARWALAAEAALGRMAGGWVPVDADLVLALHARLSALVALERQVAAGRVSSTWWRWRLASTRRARS